jgi:hypothetical protein
LNTPADSAGLHRNIELLTLAATQQLNTPNRGCQSIRKRQYIALSKCETGRNTGFNWNTNGNHGEFQQAKQSILATREFTQKAYFDFGHRGNYALQRDNSALLNGRVESSKDSYT